MLGAEQVVASPPLLSFNRSKSATSTGGLQTKPCERSRCLIADSELHAMLGQLRATYLQRDPEYRPVPQHLRRLHSAMTDRQQRTRAQSLRRSCQSYRLSTVTQSHQGTLGRGARSSGIERPRPRPGPLMTGRVYQNAALETSFLPLRKFQVNQNRRFWVSRKSRRTRIAVWTSSARPNARKSPILAFPKILDDSTRRFWRWFLRGPPPAMAFQREVCRAPVPVLGEGPGQGKTNCHTTRNTTVPP